MPSLAVCADNWDEVNTWSYNGLADTLFNVSNMCELENTDMLLQLNNFVNEHDAELSVKQLVDKCIDLSNQTGGLKSCNVTDKSDIDNWTGTLGNQQNEFCDVFVSEFVQNHNKYADSDFCENSIPKARFAAS